jgi:hypothetical protein
MICWCRYEQCRVPRMQYLRGLCFQKGEEEKEEEEREESGQELARASERARKKNLYMPFSYISIH